MAGKVKLNMDGLTELSKQVGKLVHGRVKLGVLGNHAARQDGGTNNPTIGMEHEFGVKAKVMPDGSVHELPARSWLRMPIGLILPDKIKEIGPEIFKNILLHEGAEGALNRLGSEGETVVQEAFDSGGFGHWQPLHPKTIRMKGSDAILIHTAQLRQSVSYAVEGAA